MSLMSQSTRYMHRMTPDNRRGDMMDAFVETFGEAALARVMHRKIGLNGKLPKSQDIEVKEGNASGVIIGYLTKHAHGSVTEISNSTGYNKRFVRDVLNRLFGAGMVDFDEVQRQADGTIMRVWRITARAPKAKPKSPRYGGKTNLQAVMSYLSKPGEHTRSEIAAATGATHKNVSRALHHLRKLGKAEFRRVGKLGDKRGCSTLWRLT